MNRRKFLHLTGVAGLGMQGFRSMPLWSEANSSGLRFQNPRDVRP